MRAAPKHTINKLKLIGVCIQEREGRGTTGRESKPSEYIYSYIIEGAREEQDEGL